MGLTHSGAVVKLNVNCFFQGVIVACNLQPLWLVVCDGPLQPVVVTSKTSTHVVYQATAIPSCTNGVVPVCDRPWYPPVSVPALLSINQNINLSAKSCLLTVPWALGAIYGSRSTYKVAQCTNFHHNNCCHPVDKKSPVPINHGTPQ